MYLLFFGFCLFFCFYNYGGIQGVMKKFQKDFIFFLFVFGGLEQKLQFCTPKRRERVRGEVKKLGFKGRQVKVYDTDRVHKVELGCKSSLRYW